MTKPRSEYPLWRCPVCPVLIPGVGQAVQVRIREHEQEHKNRASLTDFDRLDAIQRLINDVIREHEGHVGTHYESCWKYHAGCLAHLINEITGP